MPTPLDKAWTMTVADLRRRSPGPAFDLWIDDLLPLGTEGERTIIGVPNPLARDLMSARFAKTIADALGARLGQPVQVEFRVETAPRPAEPEIEAAAPANGRNGGGDGFVPLQLNSRFTFDNFVVGPSNRFAQAACEAVVKSPAHTYNPLFLHGGVGLGKTHLMHAVGQAMLAARPSAQVAYISGEAFLTQFVTSIRENRQDEFRRRYRHVDMWLVDDVQFLAGRDATATTAEFFHTFNALHDGQKQIVLSSDRPPKDLQLEDRLVSRFEWGLIAEINKPEEETRLAILQRRAADEDLEVPAEVLMFIARAVRDSVRLLEGSLLKVAATASLLDKQISLDLAQDCLRDYSVRTVGPELTAEAILDAVSLQFRQPTADILGKSRLKDLVIARQTAMYLCRELLEMSFVEIGALFNRDHSTVMHACTKISGLLATSDATVAGALDRVQTQLQDSH
ncbi:MAG TPA: chromosomal replication initiator protein DnaA [Armatimonadetes bacterium]|nr:chromosomal replication initiator protein DnaA [Armatimonadota bacterium]